MRPPRLFWQIFLVCTGIALLSVCTVGWLAERSGRSAAFLELEREMRGRMDLLTPALTRLDKGELAAFVRDCGASGTRMTIVDAGGRVLADSAKDPAKMPNHATRPEVARALAGGEGAAFRESGTVGAPMLYLARPLTLGRPEGWAVLRLATPATAWDKAARLLHRKLALICCCTPLVSALLAFLAARRISRPLELMRKSADRLASGDFEALPDLERSAGSAEMAALAVALRNMAAAIRDRVERLRKLERVRQDFVANVSHELRTPITIIRGYLETVLDEAGGDPATTRHFLDITLKQTNRLNAIVDDLLTLSRLENVDQRDAPLALAQVTARRVLESAAAACAPLAEQKELEFSLDCPEELTARINRPLMEQALINLVNNAVAYSPRGATVRLSAQAQQSGDGICVDFTVADSGPGIAPEHLPRLFERFYRCDKARSRERGGTGLGLAIVKHIAQVQQGKVTVHSELGKGASFTMRLPG